MDYPEQFIQALKSQWERMTETQLVDNLRAFQALRHHQHEMLAWLKSVLLCRQKIARMR